MPDLNPTKLIYSVSEVSELFGFTQKTIREWCRSGHLQAVQPRPNGNWIISKQAVEKLLGRSDAYYPQGPTAVDSVYEVWTGPLPNRFVRVQSVEAIPLNGSPSVDFGAIGPRSSVRRKLADALSLEPNDLAYFRISPTDDIHVHLADAERGQESDGFRHFVTANTPLDDPGAAFWIYGRNQALEVVVFNPSMYDITMSRVRFSGWLARTETVQQASQSAIPAITRGWR